MYECLQKEKKIVKIIPKELLGIPFKSITIPIKDNLGKVVGTISIGRSLKRQNRQLELTQSVATTLEEITESLDEISSGADNIAASTQEIVDQGKSTIESVRSTDKILQYIKKISDQANMLGLNASIEAARAGEQGRGFAVVADEIRKLSVETKNSVGEINQIINTIKDKVEKMVTLVNETVNTTRVQAESTQQILEALQEVNSATLNLSEIAKDL
ncbi:MAG: methyl-accepting chemotaxis protein [Bacillota bacterium]